MKKINYPRGFSPIELILILSILGILLFLFVPFAKLLPIGEGNHSERLPTQPSVLSAESSSISSEDNQTDSRGPED